MKNLILAGFLFISGFLFSAGNDFDNAVDNAYQNARKGLYWALSNIPEEKSRLTQSLIADDKLYAEVKLGKEINGVVIESTGHYNSYEVTIRVFKSNDNLIKEGFLKNGRRKE